MKSWSNKVLFGFITGVVCPPAAFYIFCLISFSGITPIELLEGYAKRNVLTHVTSLSVLINLAIFFIFLNTGREYSARGVLAATFIYAFIVFAIKLLI